MRILLTERKMAGFGSMRLMKEMRVSTKEKAVGSGRHFMFRGERPWMLFVMFCILFSGIVIQPEAINPKSFKPGNKSTEEMTDAEIETLIARTYIVGLHRLPSSHDLQHQCEMLRETPRTETWFHDYVLNSPEATSMYDNIKFNCKRLQRYFQYLVLIFIVVCLFNIIFVKRKGYKLCSSYGVFLWIILIWGGFLINRSIALHGFNVDSPIFTFPMSVVEFRPVVLNVWTLVFIALLTAGGIYAARLQTIWVIVIGCALVVSATLASGIWPNVFTDPVTAYGGYFMSPIESWSEFLHNFNSIQSTLECHPRTHPPFGIILTDLFYCIARKDITLMSIMLATLSLMSIPLLLIMLRIGTNATHTTINLLVLSFAAMPAFSIYAIYSLDAIILACSIIFIIGLLQIYRSNFMSGYFLTSAGLLAASLLTFGSIFFMGVLGILCILAFAQGRRQLCLTLALPVLTCLAVFIILIPVTGYNHFISFLTASRLENPEGFRGLTEPVAYLMSRFENILEIALFLSIPTAAVLTFPKRNNTEHPETVQSNNYIVNVALAVLLCLFITGAYRTGETARACLFIYPFLWLILAKQDSCTNRFLLFMAGIQTIIMQITMDFFW